MVNKTMLVPLRKTFTFQQCTVVGILFQSIEWTQERLSTLRENLSKLMPDVLFLNVVSEYDDAYVDYTEKVYEYPYIVLICNDLEDKCSWISTFRRKPNKVDILYVQIVENGFKIEQHHDRTKIFELTLTPDGENIGDATINSIKEAFQFVRFAQLDLPTSCIRISSHTDILLEREAYNYLNMLDKVDINASSPFLEMDYMKLTKNQDHRYLPIPNTQTMNIITRQYLETTLLHAKPQGPIEAQQTKVLIRLRHNRIIKSCAGMQVINRMPEILTQKLKDEIKSWEKHRKIETPGAFWEQLRQDCSFLQ